VYLILSIMIPRNIPTVCVDFPFKVLFQLLPKRFPLAFREHHSFTLEFFIQQSVKSSLAAPMVAPMVAALISFSGNLQIVLLFLCDSVRIARYPTDNKSCH
jgi:hypothetical protein